VVGWLIFFFSTSKYPGLLLLVETTNTRHHHHSVAERTSSKSEMITLWRMPEEKVLLMKPEAFLFLSRSGQVAGSYGAYLPSASYAVVLE
jgi:hypothetical protein